MQKICWGNMRNDLRIGPLVAKQLGTLSVVITEFERPQLRYARMRLELFSLPNKCALTRLIHQKPWGRNDAQNLM